MINLKKGMVLLLAGTFAFTGIGFTMTARAEGPQARALREREEKRAAEKQAAARAEDKKDHPEVWAAIRALRTARENIYSSRNEKARYKESALKSIDTALADLEGLMARD
jgi:hypothetical protein